MIDRLRRTLLGATRVISVALTIGEILFWSLMAVLVLSMDRTMMDAVGLLLVAILIGRLGLARDRRGSAEREQESWPLNRRLPHGRDAWHQHG
ncbi:hypothetical protein [Sphingomonas mollis]|uniref:Uncharacterized protein n=1 Tax=Sphingomonas mollis TaxID=2795726 RepID=A0ABS0XV46_9SPHN|nr:hypothetical protein [Sphingomonas sp. BT553]MBJ6123605.1 hypothetical protein [Sphingomonas sp. BT553]